VDVRLPRGDVDVPMEPAEQDPNTSRKPKKLPTPKEAVKDLVTKQVEEDTVTIRTGGRHSESQSTVQIPSIIDRILDLTLPMTV
jgi:hypothetical protein